MSQNTSSAVMAQRREPPDSLDYFPTPPWATRALCEWLARRRDLGGLTAWDPACGELHMARPLAEYFAQVRASDVHDYASGQEWVYDFLIQWALPGPIERDGIDWIVTNPPFNLGLRFALRALDLARDGAALLVRTQFLEGGVDRAGSSRFDRLFRRHPPAQILQFNDRVPMVKGRLDREAGTATAYCWLIWFRDWPRAETRFDWIPRCRGDLERPGDYPVPAPPPVEAPLFGGDG